MKITFLDGNSFDIVDGINSISDSTQITFAIASDEQNMLYIHNKLNRYGKEDCELNVFDDVVYLLNGSFISEVNFPMSYMDTTEGIKITLTYDYWSEVGLRRMVKPDNYSIYKLKLINKYKNN